MDNEMAGIPQLDSLELASPEAEERLNRLAIKTAYKVGDEFFEEVVIALAEILGVSHVMISECPKKPPMRVRTLAFFANDNICENVEYDLKGTPCEHVYKKGIFVCTKDVQETFPTDNYLVSMGVESYGGISLPDSQGNVVGVLCYLSDKEILDSTWQIPHLKWIQARCGAEIERVRLERIQIEQQKVVEESKRLASLGTLAAGIAHEINNPLTSIQLLVDFGLRESQANKVIPRKNLELIMDSVKSISQIVEGVLRISSNQDTKKTTCDLTAILRRACDLTFHMSEAVQIKVVLEVAGNCYVMGNPLELQQVFVNLISNAIHATSTASRDDDVKISIVEESKNYCVSISNQGPEIPEDEQSRIFEPFYTSRLSHGGTGLGLSVSRGIVEAHGGDISVQSSPELTRFLVHIPSSEGGRHENCRS